MQKEFWRQLCALAAQSVHVPCGLPHVCINTCTRFSWTFVPENGMGTSMFVFVAVTAGVLCYFLNIMCQYDKEAEKPCGRGQYFFRMDKQRGILLALCLALCPGFLWLFDQYHYGPLKAVRYLLLLAMLYPIAREDAKERLIPNRWLGYILLCRGMLFIAEFVLFPDLRMENIKFTLFGGGISGAIFFLAYVLSRHAVGMGDVKLFAVIGTCLGIRTTYFVMVVSLLFSALYGGSMVLRKKKSMKDEIAFGPFIAAGALTVLLIGI